jgi:hypothetical protein
MLAPRLLRVRLRCAGGNDYVVKERHVGRKAFSLTAPRRRLRPAGRPRYPAPRFRARAPAERHLAPGNVTCPNGGSASQLARDLALSYGRVASIKMRQGIRDDALKAFRQGRDIVAQLIRRSPDNATLPKDLAWFDSQLDTQKTTK